MPVRYSEQVCRFIEYDVVWDGRGSIRECDEGRARMSEVSHQSTGQSIYHTRPHKNDELLSEKDMQRASNVIPADDTTRAYPQRRVTTPRVRKCRLCPRNVGPSDTQRRLTVCKRCRRLRKLAAAEQAALEHCA